MVERYLRERFLDADAFAYACAVDVTTLSSLIERGLAPAPAYVVDHDGTMHSLVFGAVPTKEAPAGRWFNPATAGWVVRALEVLNEHRDDDVAARELEARFRDNYRSALLLHAQEDPIPGVTGPDRRFDDVAFEAQFPALWRHFLAGTFGLCVATPLDEAHIAAKEVVQARLTQLTGNGARRNFSDDEKAQARDLIARYEALAMPFSPAEYARSSRRRLVDDVLPHVAG